MSEPTQLPSHMQAIVATRAGGPEVLELRTIPVPSSAQGWVTIKVRAFGLNRAELFTRQGDSPGMQFPRVLGIECAGEVVAAPGNEFPLGTAVVAIMGDMGRSFDGGYAQYTSVPASSVRAVVTALSWEMLAALPEMFQTASGSLKRLQLKSGDSLLIRGGTSSVGLCAAQLASKMGIKVIATTRNTERFEFLRSNGADVPLRETASMAASVREVVPDGVDGVLELVGASTIPDSLLCVRTGGIVCMTGILGGQWVLNDFDVFANLASGALLTCYSGTSDDLDSGQFAGYLRSVELGATVPAVGRTYALEEVPQAHRDMEANRASGKLVVSVRHP